MAARVLATAALLAGAVGALAQDATAVNPVDTSAALRVLMASGESLVPRASSCFGDYGQKGPTRVNDLLAVQLGYLSKGTNSVRGACTGEACEVAIHHADGEDVYSARISFALQGRRVRMSSLQCVLTP